MDIWKYFAIGHGHHVFCNPVSEAKIDELIGLLELPEGARVLDIACGKGEFLVRTARRWGCRGVGVDISPHCVADAREKARAAGLGSALEIVQVSGSDYDGKPSSFDAAVCLGATWIWGGLAGTLRALCDWARPGGLVAAGEPFWLRDPSPDHLEAAGLTRSSWGTHEKNARAGLDLGLGLLHAITSSQDDWDRYQGYQWHAAEQYALKSPSDPDVPELMASMRKARDHYLRWGRDEIGWAIYLFRKDPWSPGA